MITRWPGLRTGNPVARIAAAVAFLFLAACLPALPSERPTSTLEAGGEQASEVPPPLSFTAGPEEPTASPAPVRARRITDGGCCPYPFWSADSGHVLFIDGPPARETAGVYAVSLEGGDPILVRPGAAALSGEGEFWLSRQGRQTVIERAADGEQWTPAVGGHSVLLSPGGRWIAWDDSPSDIRNLDRRPHEIWVSRLDGSEARPVVQTEGGGLVGWGSSEADLLVAGRIDPADDPGIWSVSLSGEQPVRLYRTERVRSALRSPQGGWVAVLSAFGGGGEASGLWLVATEMDRAIHLPLFGGYRWRSERALLVLAWETPEAAPGLWQVDVPDGEPRLLLREDELSLPIANNDWAVSPDGRWLVFLSWEDRNLWLLGLPDAR